MLKVVLLMVFLTMSVEAKRKPHAASEIRDMRKEGNQHIVVLDASKSKRCNDFQWFVDSVSSYEKSVEKDGTLATFTLEPSGNYAIRLVCEQRLRGNRRRHDSVTTAVMVEACASCDAEAKFFMRPDLELCETILVSQSMGCESIRWEVQEPGQAYVDKDTQPMFVWQSESRLSGTYNIRLTCSKGSCEDVEEKTMECNLGQCASPPSTGAVSYSVEAVGESYRVTLDASQSTGCTGGVSWKRVKNSGDKKEICTDKVCPWVTNFSGKYEFEFSCKNPCDQEDTAEVLTNCVRKDSN